MKNTLNQGFSQLYAANEKYLPHIEFRSGVGDIKRSIESTTDQIADIDPIITTPSESVSTTKTDVSVSEPIVKETPSTTGEIIIADADDEVSIDAGTPAGTDVSNSALSDIAGTANFVCLPTMDDFMGETEGTDNEEQREHEKLSEEVATERLCNFLLSSTYNALNVSHIEEASSILSKSFSKIYSDLKYVLKPIVDMLTDEVQRSEQELLNVQGSSAIAQALQVNAPTVKHIDWSVLAKLGSDTDLIADAKKTGHIHVTNVMTFTSARATTARWTQEVPTVDLPNSVKNKIIAEIEIAAGESPTEAADIDVASNPETSEGQVAAGESYLRTILKDDVNIQTEGNEIATVPPDKQTFANTPEEAYEEAKETFDIVFTDRKMSGGVRLGSENIYNKYLDLLSKFQDSKQYALPTSTQLYAIEHRVDDAYLPTNSVAMIDKSSAYTLIGHFKSVQLEYKNLAVKLKTASVDNDESYLKSVAILANNINTALSKIFKVSMVHPINALEGLHTLVKSTLPVNANWTLSDIAQLQSYIPVFEAYASFIKDLKAIYTTPRFNSNEANKIYDYGYYTLETGTALMSLLQAMTFSSAHGLVQSYICGLKNTAEKKGIEKLLHPRLDDFLTEEEDLEQKGDDINALDEEVDSENGVESLSLHLRDGQEGIFSKIKDATARTFKFTSTKYNTITLTDISQLSKIKPAQLDDTTFPLLDKAKTFKIINGYLQGKNVITQFLSEVEKSAKSKAWTQNADKSAANLLKLADKLYGPNHYTNSEVKDVIDDLEVDVSVAKSGYTPADFKKLVSIKNFFFDDLTSFVNKTLELDHYLPSTENRATLRTAFRTVMALFIGMDRLYAKLVGSLYIVYQIYNRALNSGTESLAKEVFDIVSTQKGYHRFIKTMEACMHANDTGRKIHPLLRVVDKYPKVLDTILSINTNISDEDANIIKKNTATVKGVLSCIGLYLTVCKNYFRDNQVLVIDESHVNPTVLNEFYRQDGKDSDIEMHLLHQYILPKRPVPNMGIRIADITRSAKRIAEEYDRKVASMKEQLKVNRDSTLQAVYSRVLDKYLKSTPQEKLPTGMTLKNFVSTNFGLVNITAKNLLSKNHSVDECIMKFLIELWYGNKPVYRDMYNKFEYRYRQLADTAIGEVSLRDRATADAKVVADMTMNFLFDQFVQR